MRIIHNQALSSKLVKVPHEFGLSGAPMSSQWQAKCREELVAQSLLLFACFAAREYVIFSLTEFPNLHKAQQPRRVDVMTTRNERSDIRRATPGKPQVKKSVPAVKPLVIDTEYIRTNMTCSQQIKMALNTKYKPVR